MTSDKLFLFGKALGLLFPYAGSQLLHRLDAVRHSFTYTAVPDAKNVVVLGGSHAGAELARRLSETLPTGYKTVLVDRNSHINHVFVFPRFSAVRGHEHKAFIPFDGVPGKRAPPGIFERVQDTAVEITESQVRLASGRIIDYSYLAIATGCAQPLPARLDATEKEAACAEMRGVQDSIYEARNIAVVGAGAVGVQLATDIKAYHPDKNVTIIHSRDQVMNQYGKRLHDYVLPELKEQGIRVMLNERPQLPNVKGLAKKETLTFSDGHSEAFDLVVPCTGQIPNSSLLTSFLPGAISPTTRRILVRPNLQVRTADESKPRPPIFAFGDVAETGAPKMARAAYFQQEIVHSNILSMIEGREPSKVYTPRRDIEGAIKLSLGPGHIVIYTQDDNNGREYLIPNKVHTQTIDQDIAFAWSRFNVKYDAKEARGVLNGVEGASVSSA